MLISRNSSATPRHSRPRASTRRRGRGRVLILRTLPRPRVAALACVFLWFVATGIAHIAETSALASAVPPFIPEPRLAIFLIGLVELCGATGLLWPSSRRVAGIALCAVTIVATPVLVYMFQNAEEFDLPRWFLALCFPFKAALMALIVWCTTPRRRGLPLRATTAS